MNKKLYSFNEQEKDLIALALVTYKEKVEKTLPDKEKETLKNLIRIFVYRDIV